MANLQTNVPLADVPFVDRNGNITETWFIFLVQLFRRTGGQGGDTGSITLQDVLALEMVLSPAQAAQSIDALRAEIEQLKQTLGRGESYQSEMTMARV